jgi:hypothetical protein
MNMNHRAFLTARRGALITPQPAMVTPSLLHAVAVVLSPPWGHVHVWPLIGFPHSSNALLPSITIQHNFSSALGKVPPTDPLSWKLQPPKTKGLYMLPHPVKTRARLKSLRTEDIKKFKTDL